MPTAGPQQPQGGGDIWSRLSGYLTSREGRAALGGAQDALLAQGGWSATPPGGAIRNMALATAGARQGARQHEKDEWERIHNYLRLASASGSPAAVREYQYFASLSPEEQEVYLKVKRAQQTLNLGDRYGIMNPQGTGVAHEIPKGVSPDNQPHNVAARASAQAQGSAQGQARADLPATIGSAQEALSVIDQLIAHPGRTRITGLSGTLGITGLAGKGADAKALLDQIKGKAFLQAFESLKGGGQITEIEGLKAEQAIARLNTAQTDEAFLAALYELKEVINNGLVRARMKAGVTGPQPGFTPPPEDAGMNFDGFSIRRVNR